MDGKRFLILHNRLRYILEKQRRNTA